MTPAERDKNLDTASSKCGHPSCGCLLSANRPHGDYCSEYCKENAALTEIRCQCEHPACR